jgi:hypothetical protein
MLDLDSLLADVGEKKPETKRASYPVFPDHDGTAEMLASTSIQLSEAKDQLFAKHGATEALSVKRSFKPRPAFFTSRHTLFTPEQNMAIDAVCPLVCSVKVKGVV